MIVSWMCRTSSGSGAWPRSGLMVSRTSEMPLHTTNPPTASPTQPSRSKPMTRDSTAAARTASVVMTSLRESTAVASSVVDAIFLPSPELNAAIHSFTSTEARSTATIAGANSVGEGCTSFSTEECKSSRPMAVTRVATTRPLRYS